MNAICKCITLCILFLLFAGIPAGLPDRAVLIITENVAMAFNENDWADI
jgi:hypothetical protein